LRHPTDIRRRTGVIFRRKFEWVFKYFAESKVNDLDAGRYRKHSSITENPVNAPFLAMARFQ
jgi:hypothetical protein